MRKRDRGKLEDGASPGVKRSLQVKRSMKPRISRDRKISIRLKTCGKHGCFSTNGQTFLLLTCKLA